MVGSPAWKLSAECEEAVTGYCQVGGYDSTWLFSVIYSQHKLERIIPQSKVLRSTPAFSIGALIPKFEFIGIKVDHPFPVGLIALESAFDSQLTDPERRFILAHEYSHIVMNHAPYRLLGGVSSSIVTDYISSIDDKTTRIWLGAAYVIIQTAISQAFTRQSELAADSNAVSLTGDRAGGIETIRRLGETFGGNVGAPSHWITRGKVNIPVVTYQERIDAL